MSKLTEADLLMRKDGYVTAWEVAAAVGRALSSIHRGIESEKIPGRTVGSSHYKRRYVDIHALIARGDYAEAASASANLAELAAGVPKSLAAKFTPRGRGRSPSRKAAKRPAARAAG